MATSTTRQSDRKYSDKPILPHPHVAEIHKPPSRDIERMSERGTTIFSERDKEFPKSQYVPIDEGPLKELLGNCFTDGKRIFDAKYLSYHQFVGVLVVARSDPECKNFIAMLESVYEALCLIDDFLIEIVYVPLDKTEKEARDYLDEMGPWLSIPQNDPDLKYIIPRVVPPKLLGLAPNAISLETSPSKQAQSVQFQALGLNQPQPPQQQTPPPAPSKSHKKGVDFNTKENLPVLSIYSNRAQRLFVDISKEIIDCAMNPLDNAENLKNYLWDPKNYSKERKEITKANKDKDNKEKEKDEDDD